MEHYISAYSIKVRNPLAESMEYYPLDAVGSHDLLTVIKNCLEQESISQFKHNEKVSFKIDSVTLESSDRVVYGYAKYGRYGISSEVVNTVDNSTTHNKTTDEADTMKHFFYFYLPNEHANGILLTQRIGNSGIYSKLSDEVIKFIRPLIPGSPVNFSLLRSRNVIDELSEITQAKRIRLKGTKVPEDYMNSLTEQGFLTDQSEEDYYVDVIIRSKRGGWLNLANNLFNPSEADTSDALQEALENDSGVSSETEETDDTGNSLQGNIEIETVMANGKKRMVSVTDPTSIEMYYNITDSVGMRNGHPIADEIKEYCKSLAIELSEDINRI